MLNVFEHDQCLYPSHYQLLILVELLNEQGVSSHLYLKGTGLFYEDIVSGKKYISADQFIKVVENAQRLGDASLAFRWGHSLWPGHYDVYTQVINQCHNLHDFFQTLTVYSQLVCPLIKPRVLEGEANYFVHWQDEIGISTISDFLVIAYSTAVSSLCYWLMGEKPNWYVCFSKPKPREYEEYQVAFGDALQFDFSVDMLIFDKSFFNRSWQFTHRQDAISGLITKQANAQYPFPEYGLIGWLTQWVRENRKGENQLEHAAHGLLMSPATLKRKLKRHRTSFQKIQDQVRLHTCLYLQYEKQWNNQQIAQYFQFSDANNFRKAYKRWTGMTPSCMREKMLAVFEG